MTIAEEIERRVDEWIAAQPEGTGVQEFGDTKSPACKWAEMECEHYPSEIEPTWDGEGTRPSWHTFNYRLEDGSVYRCSYDGGRAAHD